MATRYRANARVVGLDLKNEIRSTEEAQGRWDARGGPRKGEGFGVP